MNDREQIHLHESQVLVLRDAFQKKRSIWREIVPTSLYPLPPSKVGNKIEGNFLGFMTPLPP